MSGEAAVVKPRRGRVRRLARFALRTTVAPWRDALGLARDNAALGFGFLRANARTLWARYRWARHPNPPVTQRMRRDFEVVRGLWGFREEDEPGLIRAMGAESTALTLACIVFAFGGVGLADAGAGHAAFGSFALALVLGARALAVGYRRAVIKRRCFMTFGEWLAGKAPPRERE